MKKWIIILTAIILTGATSSGALAGHIYYKEMKTYEDYDKKELQMQGLENIYIESAVPVVIKPTQGAAYVEFSQKFTDILGKAPTYELTTESKDHTAYVKLEQKTDLEMYMGVKDDKAFCIVYLPTMTLNRLNVKKSGNCRDGGSSNIELKGVDAKELVLDIEQDSKVYLEGNYEKVNVSQGYGELEMHSKSPADVTLTGGMACDLKGVYSKIKAVSSSEREITVDSEEPAEITVESGGKVRLAGSYRQMNITGYGGSDIAVKSDTLCEAQISAEQGPVKLEGAVQTMDIKMQGMGQADINTTVIPKRIDILGNYNHVKLMLPSNISGMDVTYNHYHESGEPYNEGVSEYGDEEPYNEAASGYGNEESTIRGEKEIISDFILQKKPSTGRSTRYSSGDGQTKILIETNVDNSIYILDNGYISGNKGTQENIKGK